MANEIFKPVIRFIAMSDVHLKDEHSVEHDRLVKAIKDAYKIAQAHPTYKSLDALVVAGDLATSGSEVQFTRAKEIFDANLKDETKRIVSIASHEFHGEGVEPAYEKLKRILNSDGDTHEVINGFHFVAVSPSRGCNVDDDKIAWVRAQLTEAHKDDPKKPVFMFQHPHVSGTVYGATNWGEDELNIVYNDFPQILVFSGHSHAPINDPRSIHQQHYTCLGTGSRSYFELDEFDKACNTIPENSQNCDQMLIVEADEQNRVRVYPYDILTGNFFQYVWKIDEPSDPETFTYTDAKRYKEALAPYFNDGAQAVACDITEKGATITFPQATCDDQPFVNSYDIVIRRKDNGVIESQKSIWSEYYFYNMPETRSISFDLLDSNTEYVAKVTAKGFFHNKSSNSLTVEFKTK